MLLGVKLFEGNQELSIYKDTETNELMVAIQDEQNLFNEDGEISTLDIKRIVKQFNIAINRFR